VGDGERGRRPAGAGGLGFQLSELGMSHWECAYFPEEDKLLEPNVRISRKRTSFFEGDKFFGGWGLGTRGWSTGDHTLALDFRRGESSTRLSTLDCHANMRISRKGT
jgi:hypothetical protein